MKIYHKNYLWITIILYGGLLALSIVNFSALTSGENGTAPFVWLVQVILWSSKMIEGFLISLTKKGFEKYRKKRGDELLALQKRFGNYEFAVRFGWIAPLFLSVIFITKRPGLSVFFLFLTVVYGVWLSAVISGNLPPKD